MILMIATFRTEIESKNETANDQCENENLCSWFVSVCQMKWWTERYDLISVKQAFKDFAVAVAAPLLLFFWLAQTNESNEIK